MQNMDTPRTITRRGSSLILSRRSLPEPKPFATQTLTSKQSLSMASESQTYLMNRPNGSVRKEIVTYLFNSMLDSIVESWEVISQDVTKKEESCKTFEKVSSGIIQQKRKKNLAKPSKSRRSKNELFDEPQEDIIPTSWWSSPDEKAIIRFRNGNIYEGNISMKVMHGEGCFIWADGTTYTGNFKNNKMNGRGLIQWKDDTWYEGEFSGNLRHGKGMYVDSRKQSSYIGQWYSGTKNGQGVIYYSQSFKNSYDGQWLYNVRHGYGSREYCPFSVYDGEWDLYVRHGKGLMIWPNHDFYRGEWKNGVMCGNGTYIWDTFYNNSLAKPSIIMYRGQWLKGQRHGCGMLYLGLTLGAQYSGEFKNNQKHGAGMLISNNGFILKNKRLFQDGNLDVLTTEDGENSGLSKDLKREQVAEPYKFDIIDISVGLSYHVKQAIERLDRQHEIRSKIINNFIECNRKLYGNVCLTNIEEINDNIPDDLIDFELRSINKSLECYETDLKIIYYKYCTLFNSKQITFTPVLIRLYLWQMYYDCNIHEKGLTLVEIDDTLSQNPKWLACSPHDPFEPIYYWQFVHSLLSVAKKLYAKRELPGPKPDTILANAFRKFMDKDILPGINRQKGRFVNGYGEFIPLKGLYLLYQSLGEPHTLLTYLRAVLHQSHIEKHAQPKLIEAMNGHCIGRNVYVFGNDMTYVLDSYEVTTPQEVNKQKCKELKLSNFGNLSSKTIISIFSLIFPQVCEENRVVNLEVQITFFEFFEIFVACAINSVSKKETDSIQFEDVGTIAPPQTPNEIYIY